MKTLMSANLSEIEPSRFVVCTHVGGSDILVLNGRDIISLIKQDNPQIEFDSFDEVLKFYLKDMSGNSFEVLLARDNEIYKVCVA